MAATSLPIYNIAFRKLGHHLEGRIVYNVIFITLLDVVFFSFLWPVSHVPVAMCLSVESYIRHRLKKSKVTASYFHTIII